MANLWFAAVCNCHNRQEPLAAKYLASINLQEYGIGTKQQNDQIFFGRVNIENIDNEQPGG